MSEVEGFTAADADERHPHRFTVVIVLLVALAATGVLSWRWWTHTPQYALRQVASAYRDHDLARFEKYVDSERLSGSFVDQMMQSVMEKSKDDEGASWASGLVQGMAMMMRPQMVKALQDALTKGVESGDFSKESKGGPKVSDFKDYLRSSNRKESGFRGVKSVKVQGKIAVAQLEVFDADYDKSAFIDVKLRNVGDHWQVTELSNFADFMKTLQQYEKEYLDKVNAPVVRQMKEALKFESGSASTHSDSWGIGKSVVITTRFANRSNRRIVGYDASLSLVRPDGKKVTTFTITTAESISAGSADDRVWSKDVNMFISDDEKVYNAVAGGVTVSADPARVKFEDGSELKLFTSRADVTAKRKT